MINIVKNFIINNNLINPNDYVICSTSGGADSICLLHILYNLGYKVVLAHVNHHKRIESETEEKEMRCLATKLNIPFELYHYYDDGNENFHDKAHTMRYEFYKNMADKYNTKTITTAHHLDDQAETVIMRLISGSNLYGYAGISNKVNIDGYNIVRPLLCVGKENIYNYIKENNLIYFEDQSNNEDDYLRNRIRHHVIPLLKNENSNLLNQINDYSILVKEAFNYIRNQSINYLNSNNNIIDINSFKGLDISLKKDIICLLFESYNLEKTNNIINICLNLIKKNNNSSIDIKDGYSFIVEYNKAYINIKENTVEYCYELSLDNRVEIMGKYVLYFSKNEPINNEKYIKLCYNDLKLPFSIRNRKEGDTIRMNFGNKKVSRLLIDQKVEKEKRDTLPLIFDNCGDLLWVYNYAKNIDVINQKNIGDIYLVCEERKND